MADVLASIALETAAPMTEIGHSQNPEPGAEPGDFEPVWFR